MRRLLPLLVALLACACGTDPGSDSLDVVLDTESELAWRQYLANLELAQSYEATCSRERAADADHRVLVTGFGRFMSNQRNATGEMVSELLESLEYPLTEAPPPGEIDAPELQTAVAQETIELPGAGKVSVCAMVLPVFWDLAPVLVLEEAAAFEPDMVLMNGIAGPRQEIWLEQGAVNEAASLDDGSGNLKPGADAPLIADASASEHARPNYASWDALRRAAEGTLSEQASVEEGGAPFGDVVRGVRFASYPRNSNTYLCNNTTYTVGYVMDHVGEPVRLLEASHVRDDHEGGVDVKLGIDMWLVPRLFVHWPSDLRGEHLRSGAAMMRSIIDAQLVALDSYTDYPVEGSNDRADM